MTPEDVKAVGPDVLRHRLILSFEADEVLTPDSSRFWSKDGYAAGSHQESFDKQYVRDWLETLDWNKTAPGPVLPDDVVENTRKIYLQALNELTGAGL